LHVKAADQAICLGPVEQASGNPHQNIELLIDLAIRTRADGIHPGYGYLSENADFANRVIAANLIFVGPSPHAISVLGDKRTAKQYLLKHEPSVPLIPGYSGSEQDAVSLGKEAERIGYPILIKASAGGGGKGMRIVHDRQEFSEELSRAQSEANRSFGSSDCILERYIERGKHIEIQIIGDSHGNIVSLMDRECSIQRRHQKIVEESPSPWMPQDLRVRMSEAAKKLGRLLGYEGAGTVEFMVDVASKEFFFLEVNTRIQVEHPITEETTGLDIVALQLYVAAGGNLLQLESLQKISQRGHAIECRLCAEDPMQNFQPDLGQIWRWTPATEILPLSQTQDVRFETAIRTGSNISVYFDSMIAKVVVWAPTRSLAISKMRRVLANTVCVGIKTNQLFLQACLFHEAFLAGDYSTGFVSDYLDTLLTNPYSVELSDFHQLLSFLPSLLLKRLAPRKSGHGVPPPFRSIRPMFRNQRADLGLGQADVITNMIPAKPGGESLFVESSSFVAWPSQGQAASDLLIVRVQPFEIDTKSVNQQTRKGNAKVGAQLATQYGAIMANLRDSAHAAKYLHEVSLCRSKVSDVRESGQKHWLLADIEVDVDRRTLRAFMATDTEYQYLDSGRPQRVFCHIPDLGTAIEYRRFTLLSYCESLRSSLQKDDSGGSNDVKAPMPCKILRVLKKSGDLVKKGDVLIITESMKTEMKIAASSYGKFVSNVAEGDAVEADTVLCCITEDPGSEE
jgi:acetyl/propionyl-CoA carboxylase alpha subunit